MPIDPQSIPYQPQQPAPAQPFQAGAYVGAKNANQQLGLGYAQLGQQGVMQGLQDYLESQRLQQQQPYLQAQTGLAQAQAQKQQLENYWQQPYGGGSPSMSGVSDQSPQPSSMTPGSYDPAMRGTSVSSSSGSSGPGVGQGVGGFAPSAPMSVSQPGGMGGYGGGIASGPQQNYTPQQQPQGGMNWTGDHTQDFMAWKQSQGGGQQGGYGGISPQQMAMIPRGQVFQLQRQEDAYQAEAKLMSQSDQFKSVFGKAAPEDIIPMLRGAGEPGTLTKGLLELAGTQNKLGFENQRFTIGEQNKVKVDANKEFGEYTDTTQKINDAQKALSDAQNDPASTKVALDMVAKALDLPGRRPEDVANFMMSTDPTTAGSIRDWISGKTKGLSPTVFASFSNIMDTRKQGATQAFETKAQSRIQQNAQMFPGGPQQAAQSLYPGYQFGGGPGGGQNNPATNALPRNSILGRSQPTLSAQDQAALQWANANPKDARAAKIKQRLGMQ